MLLRQTLLYLPAQLLAPLFQFVAMVAWTHWLPPKLLGQFGLVVATQELCHAAVLSWFSFYVIRYVNEIADQDAYLRTEAFVLTCAGLASVVISAAVLSIVSETPLSRADLMLLPAYVVTRSLSTHLADRARSKASILAYTILCVTGPGLGLILSLTLIHYFGTSLALMLTGYIAAETIALVAAIPMIGIARRLSRPDDGIIAAAIKYGAPFVISAPVLWVSANGIRYIVELMKGTEALGYLTVGWGLGQRGASVAALMVSAAGFPLALKRMRGEGMAQGLAQLRSNGILLFMMLAPAVGGLFALAEQITGALVATAYQPATLAILPVATLAGALRNLRIHYTNLVFLLHERSSSVVTIESFDAVASTLLSIVGLLAGGLVGAVWGAAVGAAAGLAVSVLLGQREYGATLPLAEFFRIALAVVVMITVLRAMHLPASVGGLVFGIGFGAFVYVAAVLAVYPQIRDQAVAIARARMG